MCSELCARNSVVCSGDGDVGKQGSRRVDDNATLHLQARVAWQCDFYHETIVGPGNYEYIIK